MEVSIGFFAAVLIATFISIPGYITRRFYFNGQFSKQILWSSHKISNLIYSSFVGTTIIISFIYILNILLKEPINLDLFLLKYYQYFISNNKIDYKNIENNINGLPYIIKENYLPFLVGLYLYSAFIGFSFCKLVLHLGLDVKFKLFRFANQWYYLFSGKILKLENAKKNTIENKLQVKHIYLDVLVNQGGTNTLISGFFSDYDLSYKDYNKLEKLYLFHPSRWKKIDNKTTSKLIPGNIFTIFGDTIIDINTTYIYQDYEANDTKWFNFFKLLLLAAQIISILLFSFIAYFLFTPLKHSNIIYLSPILNLNIFYKALALFTFNLVLGVVKPFRINYSKKKIEFLGINYLIFSSIIILLIIIIIKVRIFI